VLWPKNAPTDFIDVVKPSLREFKSSAPAEDACA